MKLLSFGIRSSLCLILTLNTAFAEVVYLPKDGKAPYSGYLMSEDQELDTRIKLSKYEIQTELLVLKDAKEKLYQDNAKLFQDRIDSLQKQHEEALKHNLELQKTSDIMKVIYFLGGALITTAIVFGVQNAQK